MELAAETSRMALANLYMRRPPSEEDVGARVPAVVAEEVKVMEVEVGEAAITNNKHKSILKGRMSITGNLRANQMAGKASRHRRGSSLLMRR
jgi:hypothetical protein